jgi:hypothetical protein
MAYIYISKKRPRLQLGVYVEPLSKPPQEKSGEILENKQVSNWE